MNGRYWAVIIVITYFAVPCLIGWAVNRVIQRQERRQALREAALRSHLHAHAERMFPGSDSPRFPDLCDPDWPCDWEDNYQCRTHRQKVTP